MKYSFTTLNNMPPAGLGEAIVGDVAIVSASWESRSKTALAVLDHVEIRKLIVIRFSNSGRTGVSGNIRNQYKAFCRDRKVDYREFLFDSTSSDYASLVEVSKSIDTAVGDAKHAIVDVTSTPRLLWCSLVALWDKKDLLRSITFLYARPNYFFTETPDRKLIFDYTEGHWQLLEPAFIQPTFKGGLSKKNFISIGYEYDHIKKMLYKFASDINVLVYSDPGFRKEYTVLAASTVSKIKNVFDVPDANFMAYAVHDFVGLQHDLNLRITEADDRPGVSILLVCAGSKIHSLAFLFCALQHPEISLRVRVPTRYKEVSTEWASGIEAITAENIFAPL